MLGFCVGFVAARSFCAGILRFSDRAFGNRVSSLGLFLCTYVRKTLCLKVPDTHVSGDKIQRQFLALLPDYVTALVQATNFTCQSLGIGFFLHKNIGMGGLLEAL